MLVTMTPARTSAEPWQHRFVEANGLRFHVVTQEPAPEHSKPAAPLVVLLHGFPEFWYSWRHQIPALAAAGFAVAAPDLRGYNDSEKPEGVEAYRISNVVEDVAGLIRALGRERAVIVGHDWGGAAAYAFAMMKPEMTSRLCVMNSPHPARFVAELSRGNEAQLRRSWYMFFFQLPEAPERLFTADGFRMLKGMLTRSARKGTFPPTVLAPVRPDDPAYTEEVFGPVVTVTPFSDEADAVAIANDTPYGLSGSIWTSDVGRAIRVARAVETGNLSVNSHSSVRYWTPFGGFKQSGLGRELGPDAPDAFTEVKNVFISTQE